MNDFIQVYSPYDQLTSIEDHLLVIPRDTRVPVESSNWSLQTEGDKETANTSKFGSFDNPHGDPMNLGDDFNDSNQDIVPHPSRLEHNRSRLLGDPARTQGGEVPPQEDEDVHGEVEGANEHIHLSVVASPPFQRLTPPEGLGRLGQSSTTAIPKPIDHNSQADAMVDAIQNEIINLSDCDDIPDAKLVGDSSGSDDEVLRCEASIQVPSSKVTTACEGLASKVPSILPSTIPTSYEATIDGFQNAVGKASPSQARVVKEEGGWWKMREEQKKRKAEKRAAKEKEFQHIKEAAELEIKRVREEAAHHERELALLRAELKQSKLMQQQREFPEANTELDQGKVLEKATTDPKFGVRHIVDIELEVIPESPEDNQALDDKTHFGSADSLPTFEQKKQIQDAVLESIHISKDQNGGCSNQIGLQISGESLSRKFGVIDSAPACKWLNIVLDINGILCQCVERTTAKKKCGLTYKIGCTMVGPKGVYVRPGLHSFLASISQFAAHVVIWSSMKRSTVEQVVDFLFQGFSLPYAILGQDSCTKIETTSGKYVTTLSSPKEIFLKILDDRLFSTPCRPSPFNKDNTLLIDDSPEKSVCNETGNAVFLKPWSRIAHDDLFLEEYLLPWLQRLHHECNPGMLREFVDKNRIGCPPLPADSGLFAHMVCGMNLSAKNLGIRYNLRSVGAIICPPTS